MRELMALLAALGYGVTGLVGLGLVVSRVQYFLQATPLRLQRHRDTLTMEVNGPPRVLGNVLLLLVGLALIAQSALVVGWFLGPRLPG